jgi:hypothetical protein
MPAIQPIQILSPYNPAERALIEPIVEPLYDSGTVTTATTTFLDFFKIPLGQGVVAKTLVDTNLRLAGQLGNPNVFLITGFRFQLTQYLTQAETNIDDAAIILYTSYYSVDIGDKFKNYLEQPTFRIPGGLGLYGFAASTTVAVVVTNGLPNGINRYSIEKYPIGLAPNETFGARIQFPGGAATLTTDTKVWTFWEGIRGRAVG